MIIALTVRQVINACLLTSAWSAASSDLYTSSRALCTYFADLSLSMAIARQMAYLNVFLFLQLSIRRSGRGRKCSQNLHEDVSQWPSICCNCDLFVLWPTVFHGNQIRLGTSFHLVCEYDCYRRYFDSPFTKYKHADSQNRAHYMVWNLGYLYPLLQRFQGPGLRPEQPTVCICPTAICCVVRRNRMLRHLSCKCFLSVKTRCKPAH